jgi:hypothetical protein
LKKRFDDHQVPAADKLFFPVFGSVFLLGDGQAGKIPADA